jgi:hypothetical protein
MTCAANKLQANSKAECMFRKTQNGNARRVWTKRAGLIVLGVFENCRS